MTARKRVTSRRGAARLKCTVCRCSVLSHYDPYTNLWVGCYQEKRVDKHTAVAPTDFEVVEAMLQYGGSFVRKLGEAFRVADAYNQDKLKAAFPEYWRDYTIHALRTRR